MDQNGTDFVNRARAGSVALETTLLLHGVPRAEGPGLARELAQIARDRGAQPVFVGVVAGRPTVGLTDTELNELFSAPTVPKANTANLGVLIHRRAHGATTVSTTMELAARAGVRAFGTGGLGGVHRDYASHLDISSDLAAFTRFPIAVVASGVKSILDVHATREMLESLGVPVVGYRTDHFPAFYLRQSAARLDARFDDAADLAAFVAHELARTGRGIVVANPVPAADELNEHEWRAWLDSATREAEAQDVRGRDLTPFLLGRVHALSEGKTLRANLSLIRSNTALAAELAALMSGR
jgi:pseudouridine-5'-phosphate glycosidase